MKNNTHKNYNSTNEKLKNNFEDVQYLIALHLKVLEKIDLITQRIDRMQSSIDSIYAD